MAQTAIYRYEHGVTDVPNDILLWYADFFDVSLDYIYGRTDKPQVMQKELQDATNIHLSADAIVGLVETYLEKRLGTEFQYVVGNGVEKKLRLNADNRQTFLFSKCENFSKICKIFLK